MSINVYIRFLNGSNANYIYDIFNVARLPAGLIFGLKASWNARVSAYATFSGNFFAIRSSSFGGGGCGGALSAYILRVPSIMQNSRASVDNVDHDRHELAPVRRRIFTQFSRPFVSAPRRDACIIKRTPGTRRTDTNGRTTGNVDLRVSRVQRADKTTLSWRATRPGALSSGAWLAVCENWFACSNAHHSPVVSRSDQFLLWSIDTRENKVRLNATVAPAADKSELMNDCQY